VKALVALLLLAPSPLEALGSHPRPSLPDRLTAVESARSVRAAERALLEPAYRKRGLGLDDWGRKLPHFDSWGVIPRAPKSPRQWPVPNMHGCD
jgi:hypothetical protein